MDDTHLHNNNRSTSKYFLQSAHQDKGSHFLVSSLGGVVLSHLSVCRLVFGRWLLSSDLAAIPALSLPLTLYSLSDQLPNDERKDGGRKQVCFRVIAVAAVTVFALVLVRISCVKLVLLLHRSGVVARNDISKGEIPERMLKFLKELCDRHHCLRDHS